MDPIHDKINEFNEKLDRANDLADRRRDLERKLAIIKGVLGNITLQIEADQEHVLGTTSSLDYLRGQKLALKWVLELLENG